MQPIFVGQTGSGKGYRLWPVEGSLVTEQPKFERAVAVEQNDNGWREVGAVGLYQIPVEAMKLAQQQLASRASEALRFGGRIIKTNSSYEEAQSRGRTVTIYTRAGRYVAIATDWSKWEGDGISKSEIGTYDSLDDAVRAAECECSTRPSFGDCERVR